MRRIAVYRDGNQMAAQIGPDWVEGIAGFGDTVAEAVRDLSQLFATHDYDLRGNAVGIEVAGLFIEVNGAPGQSPTDILLRMAEILEERGFQESAFPEPNWAVLASEERLVPSRHQNN